MDSAIASYYQEENDDILLFANECFVHFLHLLRFIATLYKTKPTLERIAIF